LNVISAAGTAAKSRPISSTAWHGVRAPNLFPSISPRAAWPWFPARLQIRDWTDREGNKRRSAEVVADNIYFGDSKRRDGGDNRGERADTSYSAPKYEAPAADSGAAFAELSDDDGELPF
jgi:hypothetical protein